MNETTRRGDALATTGREPTEDRPHWRAALRYVGPHAAGWSPTYMNRRAGRRGQSKEIPMLKTIMATLVALGVAAAISVGAAAAANAEPVTSDRGSGTSVLVYRDGDTARVDRRNVDVGPCELLNPDGPSSQLSKTDGACYIEGSQESFEWPARTARSYRLSSVNGYRCPGAPSIYRSWPEATGRTLEACGRIDR